VSDLKSPVIPLENIFFPTEIPWKKYPQKIPQRKKIPYFLGKFL